VKTKQRETQSRERSQASLVYWISLAEAERRFDVTRGQLIARIRDSRFEARRTLCDGDLVVAVSSKELADEFELRPVGSFQPVQREDESGALEAVRAELQETRVSRARLEGELASSEKIERSLQRYTDRLETELEQSRKQAMTLARALGRAERLAASSTKQLAAVDRPSRPRRRAWWKLWG